MDSSSQEPIRLSNDETQLLTRALTEAQAQADVPNSGESETQFIRRIEAEVNRKSANTQSVHRDTGNMIL